MTELDPTSVFVWLRPWWLVALLPLAVILYRCLKLQRDFSDWDNVVDRELAPHVLESSANTRARWPLLLVGLCWLIAVLVLAGPSWERQEMPVFTGDESDVLILDLSRSMDVQDLKPSRLALTKFKVEDFLGLARGRQVGLVVFSEVPYVVSPLTDDVATLRAFLPALETSVVPVQGSQLGPAIRKGHQLLQQSDVGAGNLILLTDGRADASAISAANRAAADGYTLSVIGVGTEAGLPLQDQDGGLVQDASGKIILPKLEREGLADLARAGGGVYSDLTADDGDLKLINKNRATTVAYDQDEQSRQAVNWIEHGPLLLPLILICLLFAFRRGVLR